jgi:hypothetical protein
VINFILMLVCLAGAAGIASGWRASLELDSLPVEVPYLRGVLLVGGNERWTDRAQFSDGGQGHTDERRAQD